MKERKCRGEINQMNGSFNKVDFQTLQLQYILMNSNFLKRETSRALRYGKNILCSIPFAAKEFDGWVDVLFWGFVEL